MSPLESKLEEDHQPERSSIQQAIDYVRSLTKDVFPSEKKPEVEEAERIERLMESDVEEA